jgi:hypothetical protein
MGSGVKELMLQEYVMRTAELVYEVEAGFSF